MPQNPPLPDPTSAYNTLLQGPHANVFFGQLAARGYAPGNEKEAADLLELAGKLAILVPTAEKTASSRFTTALSAANNLLSRYGHDAHIKKAAADERELAFRAEAARLAAVPQFYNATLSLKAAQADAAQ